MRCVISLFLFGSLCMSAVYAATHDENQCMQLHIQIANSTDTVCTMTSHKVLHGNLITSPPLSILPGDSKRFDMIQTFLGPKIMLSYLCGNENITFTSQQNSCIAAGDISGKILSPMPDKITAKFTAIYGSFLWGIPGSINWEIIPIAAAN